MCRSDVRLHDVRFGDLLVDQADHLVTAAQHLAEVLGADQAQPAACRPSACSAVDQSAEAAAHAMLRALSAAFVTPFDRADVYRRGLVDAPVRGPHGCRR